MQRYQCTVCGYLYDDNLGDPDGGAPFGTAFTDIIDSWACPICGAEKSKFVKEQDD
jgi:rubredoxin